MGCDGAPGCVGAPAPRRRPKRLALIKIACRPVAEALGDQPRPIDPRHLCREIGAQIQWDRPNRILHTVTPELKTSYIPQRYSGSNRIPILMIGALLGRTDEDIIVPTVGGDLLGARPVDLHIHALQALGARIEYRVMKKEGAYFAQAHQGLRGSIITLKYPSVGATENAILAAVRARAVLVSSLAHNLAGSRRQQSVSGRAQWVRQR